MSVGVCITCEKEIFEEQDYTTLVCHAAGQTNCHTSLAHDKCWEKFKKSFIRGRGTSNRTQTFFCPVSGCHNALEHQHVSKGKKTHSGEQAKIAFVEGGDAKAEKSEGSEDRKAKAAKRAALLAAQEEEEEEDDSNTCRGYKADGTRCGRNVFDAELGVCKQHVDWARKQKEFMERKAKEEEERERQEAIDREKREAVRRRRRPPARPPAAARRRRRALRRPPTHRPPAAGHRRS